MRCNLDSEPNTAKSSFRLSY